MEAKQTPLIELLERIPQDARLVVEHDQFSSSLHPVGRLCREAAAALRAALAEQDEAAVYVPTVVSWSGGPMPFATIRVRLDETPTEYEYVPAHNTAEQAQPVAWAEQIVEHLTALHDTEMIQEIDSGDDLIRLDDATAVVDEARDRYTTPPAPQPLTIERLRDALVASRIIPPEAVEDADHYDDSLTLHRIEALFRRIT